MPTQPGLQTVPTPQPQPSGPDYGLTALDLLPTYDRAGYLAAAGTQAPAYDPTQPTKSWAATVDQNGNPIAANTASVTFNYWVPAGNNPPSWGSFTITGAEALAFNIPGFPSYPAYVIAPTPATQGGDIQAPNPIPADQLSTMTQAVALAESWGMTAAQASACIADTYSAQFAPYSIDYNGETRLWLTIDWNGTFINVGQQLEIMYAAGVGAPGAWIVSGAPYVANSSEPVWVSTQPSAAPPLSSAIIPVPQRALLPGEQFIATLMAVEVENTLAPGAPTTGGGGGGLTSAQAAQLTAVEDGINVLLGVFAKPPAA
ncbi:MAG TPA: hypothetical protein VGG72_30265 [Bryobacteraceae bacterium]|jgi:hypothetical protein